MTRSARRLGRAAAVSIVALGAACSSSSDDSNANGGGPGADGGTPAPIPPDGVPAKNGVCPHDLSTEPGVTREGITIPTKHPRLWWTPERLARAKAWIAAHPFEPRDDDRLGQLFVHVVRGVDCSSNIAWATGFTIEDSEFTTASDHLRWSGEEAILVYDWCYDQLTDAQKTTLIGRWNGYLSRANALPWGGPTMPGDNYYWGYLRNDIEWGIATFQENATALDYLKDGLVTRWHDSFLPFASGTANGDGRGGLPQEGTQYGAYIAQYPVNPFVTASLLGRSLYDESEFFKDAVFYVLYSTTPASTTSAVDGHTGFELFPYNDDEKFQDGNSAWRFADFMAEAAMTWDCLPVGKLARSWSKLVGAKPEPYIASVDKGGDALDIATLPLDYYATGARYYYGRSAWGGGATTFHWQLGDYSKSGVGHVHYDFGNFQIWRRGRWLTRESTGYADLYTGFGGTGTAESAATIAHNGLLMNGRGAADPSDGVVDGPPVVTRLESKPDYAYAAVDLTKSYRNGDPYHPERDNPSAAHVERELVFVRALETTIIFDRVQSNAVGATAADAVTKTFLAHFEKAPVVEDPSHVTYTSGDQALRLSVLVPAAPETRVIDESKAGSKVGQFRVEVNTSGAAQSYFLTVLQAKDASAAALSPTVTDDGPTFTVTLDASTKLVFTKGASTSGGAITIGGAQTNLRPDVQGIKITDAGPSWL